MGAGKGRGGASCVCYWGCGNVGNIIVWCTFAVSACLGIGLIIGGAAGGHDCMSDYQNCIDNNISRDTCQTYYNKKCNLNKYQGLLGSGIIIFFFITPLITSYFCCCATRPTQPGQDGTGMVVVTSAPVPPQGAYPYPYPAPPGYQGFPPQAGYPPGQPAPYGMPPPGQPYPAPGQYPAVPGGPAAPTDPLAVPPVVGMPAKQV